MVNIGFAVLDTFEIHFLMRLISSKCALWKFTGVKKIPLLLISGHKLVGGASCCHICEVIILKF